MDRTGLRLKLELFRLWHHCVMAAIWRKGSSGGLLSAPLQLTSEIELGTRASCITVMDTGSVAEGCAMGPLAELRPVLQILSQPQHLEKMLILIVYVGLAELPDRTFHCAKGDLISLDDQVRTTSRLMQKVAYITHERPERRQAVHNQSIAK
jgi:hypothetical protein